MKKTLFFLTLTLLAFISFGQSYRVNETSDGVSFNCKMQLLEETKDFQLYKVSFPSPKAPFWKNAQLVKGFYYKPIISHDEDFKPRPAVLCMHILGGNGGITKGIASFFATNGLPAFMPMMPLFLDRRPNLSMNQALTSPDGPRYLIEGLEAIPGDIRRSLDFLASLPEVDKNHLNIIGTSLGGILAAHATGANPRIEKGVFLLGGGDLADLLSQGNEEVAPIALAIQFCPPPAQARIKNAIQQIEPLNYADVLAKKAAQGNIRMYNAENDQIVPYANTKKLADAIGLELEKDFFIMPGVDHYTAIAGLPKLLSEALEFFQTPESAQAAANSAENSKDHDTAVIKGLFQELQFLLAGTPAPGKAIDIEMAIRFLERGNEKFAGNLAINIDANRHRILLSDWRGLGDITAAGFGVADTPWVTSGNGTQFLGDETPAPTLLSLLPTTLTGYRQMGTFLCQNIATTGSLALLQQMAGLTYDFTGKDRQNLDIKVEDRNILIQLDGHCPKSIQVAGPDTMVQIEFKRWSTQAEVKDEDFLPPNADAPAKFNVNSDDLVRSLAAVLNHGMTTLIVK